MPSIGKYRDLELRSVNRSDATDDFIKDGHAERNEQLKPLLKKIKKVLGERVKDVRVSERLTDSPSCIVADGSDPTIQMQHLMKLLGQESEEEFQPILEVNPDNDIIKKLDTVKDGNLFEDISWLLLEQAMLIEGAAPKDTAAFTRRLNNVLTKAL